MEKGSPAKRGVICLSKSWKESKIQRAKQIGGYYCEDCGKPLTERTVIGHHIHYRRDGRDDSVKNCRLRCVPCEIKDPHRRSYGKKNAQQTRRNMGAERPPEKQPVGAGKCELTIRYGNLLISIREIGCKLAKRDECNCKLFISAEEVVGLA